MRKVSIKISLLSGAGVVLLGTVPVAALQNADGSAPTAVTSRSAASSNAAIKLSDAKEKVCKARMNIINNTMDHIAKRGQNHIDDISQIASRVENFYTKSGKILSNYNALVSDVNAKKSAAQTAVNTVKSDQASFSCDGTDPKGVVSTFKTDVKAMETANKAYRDSTKKLVDGVKSVVKPTTGGAQ